jgi:integrase
VSVTRNPNGSLTIRVRPYPQQTLPPGTPKATAHALELDLKLRKKLGENYQPSDITLEQAIRDFLRLRLSQGAIRPRSVEALEREAKAWKPFYAHKLGMLRRPEVEDYIYNRAAYHRRSAKNELEFLKRVLKLARDRGHSFQDNLLGIPPIQHQAKTGQAKRVEAVVEIAAWMPEHSKRIPLLAFETGMRISEILNLRTEDLDLDNKAGAVLTVTDAKTDAGARTVYLNRAAAKVLREQLLVRAPSGFVFPHRTGKQWDRFAFTKEYIRARRRAGHPDFNFHQLRHSAVSHLGEAGLRLEHVAAQVGWSPGSMAAMASRYRHVFDGELPERIRAMDEMRERAI